MPQQQDLWAALSSFVRTMMVDVPVPAIIEHLVVGLAEILPITGAGVTLTATPAFPAHTAASGPIAAQLEALQTSGQDSPWLRTRESDSAVEIPDMAAEANFRGFTTVARGLGVGAMFTFPLRHADRQLGILSLYRDRPGPLSREASAAAQTLADVAAAYLVSAQERIQIQDSKDRAVEATRHDALTGLPNRDLVLERIEQALARSGRTQKISAVLFIDLDRFKVTNDTYGHTVGDELLVMVGHRLRQLLRAQDTVARLHGDEFVLLCEDLDDPSEAAPIMIRVDAALIQPFELSGMEVKLSVSVGISFADSDHHDAVQVVRDAESAMNDAKSQGGGQLRVFDPRYQHLAAGHAGMARDLRGALHRGELYTEYQPIVRISDGMVTGFEALLRWEHPTRGRIPPDIFIPIAEQAGLINEIGDWVLHQSLIDRHRFDPTSDGSPTALTMSVNVSTQQLMSDNYPATVARALRHNETAATQLILEVTESVFVRDGDHALRVLDQLKAIGVGLALDDFGTGYSSLSYLRQFPVDIVKIDRTFVAQLGVDQVSHIIVNAVIRLAHALNLTVVAEGIELVEQLDELARLGCDRYQGYFFARPMRAGAVDELLAHRVESDVTARSAGR